jgi:acetyl esterase/lipase
MPALEVGRETGHEAGRETGHEVGREAGLLPVAIVIHGGFWRARFNLEFMGHFAQALTDHGFATWSIEYRRIGQPGGAYPGTLLDAGRAADHLRTLAAAYPLDLRRVLAIGHSAGGHLACWLAARPQLPATGPLYNPDPLPLQGAISLAGVTNLRRGFELNLSEGVVGELLGGSPAQYPERYFDASPSELLPLGVPQVLIHGEEDTTVPFSLSREYFEKAERLGDPVKLVGLPGADHFEVIDPKAKEWAVIVENTLALSRAARTTGPDSGAGSNSGSNSDVDEGQTTGEN